MSITNREIENGTVALSGGTALSAVVSLLVIDGFAITDPLRAAFVAVAITLPAVYVTAWSADGSTAEQNRVPNTLGYKFAKRASMSCVAAALAATVFYAQVDGENKTAALPLIDPETIVTVKPMTLREMHCTPGQAVKVPVIEHNGQKFRLQC